MPATKIATDATDLRRNREAVREAEYQRFQAWCASEAAQALVERPRPPEFGNPLAQAQMIAWERQEYGAVRPETLRYARLNNGSGTLEAVGQAFIGPAFRIEFTGNDFVDQKGESELAARRFAVLGATVLRMEHPEADLQFLEDRSVFELVSKLQEVEIMRTAPNGTAMLILSPPEIQNRSWAKKLGMFPDRNMAVGQVSHKVSDTALDVYPFSLDGADLDSLRDIAAGFGTDISADARAEDFLTYRIMLHADTAAALRANIIDRAIHRFDDRKYRLTGKVTKQGRPVDADIDAAAVFWEECGDIQDDQLAFDEALSYACESKARPLHPDVRKIAQGSLHALRSDGSHFLNQHERTLLRNLLAADRVTDQNVLHAEALHIVKDVFDHGIDGEVRKFFARKGAFTADYTPVDLARAEAAGADGDLVSVATAEVEAGRTSDKCGRGTSLGEQSTASVSGQAAAMAAQEGISITTALRRIEEARLGICVVDVECCIACKKRKVQYLITPEKTKALCCKAVRMKNGDIIYPKGHRLYQAESEKEHASKEDGAQPPRQSALSVGQVALTDGTTGTVVRQTVVGGQETLIIGGDGEVVLQGKSAEVFLAGYALAAG